ncbi:hypothetical protein Tco_0124449, partial [Tanacetum coccineum]
MPYELIKGRKPNVQYFYVFGSLCYPINDHSNLGKMMPKTDIGIFVGYSESSRSYGNHSCKNNGNNSGPGLNCLNFQDSSEELNEIPLKEDLDNLFGPLYEEYYETRTTEVSDIFAANTIHNEYIPSSFSIIVEDHEAPQLVSSSKEPIANEPTTLVFDNNFDKQDLSNMHEFHQQHRFIDRWTKNHPLKQVIGDPSKPVITRHRLHTNAEMRMYALT